MLLQAQTSSNTKNFRKKFDLIQQIKYRLVFDQVTDSEELARIFKDKKEEAEGELLAEIIEEEKICAAIV